MADRADRRILAFLARDGAVLRAAAKEGLLLLDGGNRGTISVDESRLLSLVRQGVLGRDGGKIVLRGEGHGQEPFATPRINQDESPLGQLRRHKDRNGNPFLDDSEFRAGERLRADYTRAQIMPRLGANWDSVGRTGRHAGTGGGAIDLSDAALAARQRVSRAIEAVGPELAGVLIDICCFLKGLASVETERGWPVRSAKVVLKAALGALSRHYEPGQRRDGVRHWGAEGYRPVIMGSDRGGEGAFGIGPDAPDHRA